MSRSAPAPSHERSRAEGPVIDGARLRTELTAAALESKDDPERRRRALALLKNALRQGRAEARAHLEAGAGGIETARLLAGVTDEVVTALYDFVTVHVVRARNPTSGERVAVVAVGGYGRGAMAPFSDVDLLFLRPYKQTAHIESLIEFMLYMLWDLGLKVGQASRTVDECIRYARSDLSIRTALLEARVLTGDRNLAAELKRRFRKEVAAGTGAEFVAAKLAERDRRYERSGASRYMVEPNVKEGKGGLRDLNTLFWIAQYLHPAQDPAEFVQLKAFTAREVKAFLRASDFLWEVRCHMHFLTGRAEERLSFDLQPELAQRLGYGHAQSDGDNAAVERFMRRYFLIAREVGVLTRTFCAKLEAEHAKKPQGLSRFLPFRGDGRRRTLAPGFIEEDGRIQLDHPAMFARDPVAMLRLFRIADRGDLDLHPDTFSAVTRSLNAIGSAARRDPEAARAFLDVLAYGHNTRRSLTLMNESGVLGRYLPEFGRVVCQMQFNMYHAYTTDEHTLKAVGFIADLASGRPVEDQPLAGPLIALIEDREALFLAMLLHDTGKGGAPGGQSLAGARNARQACERLGLAEERIELVAWLVQHHLVMSDFAQKRDIGDPRAVAAFARIAQTPERLRLLTVITAADIRAVGPGVWNGWKGQLLSALYTATEAMFRGGRASGAAGQPGEPVGGRGRAGAEADDPALTRWAGAMEDTYLRAFPLKVRAEHFALAQRAAESGGAAASARVVYDGLVTEVVVAAADRSGLFAAFCGVLARCGANIVGARVYTSVAGEALDVFYVQDHAGEPYGRDDARALDRLVEAFERPGPIQGAPVERSSLDLRRSAAFAVAPAVTIDNEASDQATVVEVSGRDRPGLLQVLAQAIAAAGLSVQSAHVENYGERAVDAFYVVDRAGGKVEEEASIHALKQALVAALLAAEPEVEKTRIRLRARDADVPA